MSNYLLSYLEASERIFSKLMDEYRQWVKEGRYFRVVLYGEKPSDLVVCAMIQNLAKSHFSEVKMCTNLACEPEYATHFIMFRHPDEFLDEESIQNKKKKIKKEFDNLKNVYIETGFFK